MGALFGIWHFDQRDGAHGICQKMARNLVSYSSDRTSIATHDGVAMGENFVQHLPEDRAGMQPLRCADDRFLMVVDGWVDNRAELLAYLSRPDLTSGSSDAEVIFASFLKWGSECCDRIYGGFCFAVWDAVAQSLTFGRDVQGQRPLFYHVNQTAGFVAFASLPSALHTLADVPRAPDYDELEYAAATLNRRLDRTFFEGIRRVPARHVTTIDRTNVRHRVYWTPDLSLLDLPSAQEYVAAVRETYQASLASALRGHTNVASLISAGHDSPYLTLTAARALAPDGHVAAFTAAPREGFEDASAQRLVDESPIAGQLAKLEPNITHRVIRPDGQSYLDLVATTLDGLQSPAIEPVNGRWFDLICQEAAQQGHTLLLDGEIGNLTFSHDGHLDLFDDLSEGRYVTFTKKAVTRLLGRRIGVRRFWSILALRLFRRQPRSVFTPKGRAPYLIAHQEAIAIHAAQRRTESGSHQGALVRIYFDLDLETWPFHLWQRYGLEHRDPFLDRRMLELSLRLPAWVCQFDGRPRAISRSLLSEFVPKPLLSQLTRGLQGADWHEQFLDEIDTYKARVAEMKQHPDIGKVVDLERFSDLLETFPNTRRNAPDTGARYRTNMHQAIAVGSFIKKYSAFNAAPDSERE